MPLSIIKDVGNASCEKIIEERNKNEKDVQKNAHLFCY